LLGVILAYVLHAPLITTALFLVVLLAVAFGRRASLIYRIGTLVLKSSVSTSEGEDPRLMRFNNALAATFLGVAQLAFVLHAPLIAWIVAGLAALAATVALAGFCFGCFLLYSSLIGLIATPSFRLHRRRSASRRLPIGDAIRGRTRGPKFRRGYGEWSMWNVSSSQCTYSSFSCCTVRMCVAASRIFGSFPDAISVRHSLTIAGCSSDIATA